MSSMGPEFLCERKDRHTGHPAQAMGWAWHDLGSLGCNSSEGTHSAFCALQNQGHMDRDLRQMEGMVEDMRRRNDPLTAHYERQTLIVKTRKEQLGDMYCGYAASVSVCGISLRDIMCM